MIQLYKTSANDDFLPVLEKDFAQFKLTTGGNLGFMDFLDVAQRLE